MKFETLETLVLLLIFGVPGAVFLYAYSRAYSPIKREGYIRQQFPFELTVFYLVASSVIHSLLLAASLLCLNLSSSYFNDPQILSRITNPLLDVTSADAKSLTLSVSVVLLYFGASLAVAYATGMWWGNRYVPSVPLWVRELVEFRAASLKRGEGVQLKLLLRDGMELEGEWDRFGFLGGKESAFEITLRQAKKGLVIWVDSSNITEMDAISGAGTKKFIFRQPEEGSPKPTEKDSEPVQQSTS